jgi:glycosyltransferase involved in cell wall biosynthesis
VAEKRIVRVRNPVARIEPAQCPPRSDVLLYVGRLAVEKSPELLLPLARRLPGAKVQVAGEGPMREPLGVAATRGRIWNLELLGHLGPEELSRAYARASAVVLTSRCTENSPAVLLEAMAAGQCVIAPDQPAIREWITDGETGRLYPTGDVDAFVAAAREALADRRQRTRLGQAAAERIAAMHDTQAIVETTEAAYEAARQIARRRCESP